MFRSTRRQYGAGLAVALAVGALAAPTALAQPTDAHGPGVGNAAAGQAQLVDQRSPDVRDMAAGRQIVAATVVRVPTAPTTQPDDQGFDWADAAIGAGSILGIAFAGLGGTLALTRRRQRPLNA